MNLQENVPLKGKTTMRIGGNARYFAELQSREDVEEAVVFARSKKLPIVLLGGGSNTIFADGTINALVVRTKADNTGINGNTVIVEAGKTLAVLINELAEQGLDLSALTGIPGTVGGAVFGNAGQGPRGIWLDSFVVEIEAYVDGQWKKYAKDECGFGYRESGFKAMETPPVIWSAILNVPSGEPPEIKADVERLLQKRIETQPHVKTSGSCFLALGDIPAWQLIDAVGMRGSHIGDVEISEKHANFLLNKGDARFNDAAATVEEIQKIVLPADEGRNPQLRVEMRFIQNDGTLKF